MAWRIRMAETRYAGGECLSAWRVLDAEFPTHARAFAFTDALLERMSGIGGSPKLKFEIFEVPPQEPAPRQWGQP